MKILVICDNQDDTLYGEAELSFSNVTSNSAEILYTSEVDISGLVENKGIMYFWNDQNLKSRELEIRIRNELGVKQQLLSPKEIHDLEPNIKLFYHGGVFYSQARHTRNPKKILLKLLDHFREKGGRFIKININDVKFDNEIPILQSETQKFIFEYTYNGQPL